MVDTNLLVYAPDRRLDKPENQRRQTFLPDCNCKRRILFMENIRRSEEQIVPRGQEIYERRVRPGLGQAEEGAFVVIDIESGDYEVAVDEEEAFAGMEARRPGAVFFFSRVGPEGEAVPAHRIGARH